MSILRKLRESRKLSLKKLAKEIEVDPKELDVWENNSTQIPKYALSAIAYYFGFSSDDLQDAINGSQAKLTTNIYHRLIDEDSEDGLWGHFGIRLNGQSSSTWFPITLGVADDIFSELSTLNSKDKWLIVETLNNRVLVFRPSAVNRLWTLDDRVELPGDDWCIPWDGYAGNPGEFYKALEEYYFQGMGFGDDLEVSAIVKKDVENFTDVHDLDLDLVERLVLETHVYDIDGSEHSHYIDESKLVEIVNNIEYEWPQLMFDLGSECFDLYVPVDNVALINMPKRRVDLALREHYGNLEELDCEA